MESSGAPVLCCQRDHPGQEMTLFGNLILQESFSAYDRAYVLI